MKIGRYTNFFLSPSKMNLVIAMNVIEWEMARLFYCLGAATWEVVQGLDKMAVSYTHLDVYKRQV